MKTFSRYGLLVIAIVLFICCTDHVIALLIPYIPKLAGKTVAKTFKTLDDIGRFVRNV